MSASAIELPLFPLNVVLFPGVVLPLHIFEPRYRQMIADCQQHDQPFGVVLARPESKHLEEEPYPVGTMAEIRNLNRLEDGRFVLMALGLQRFRIVSQHRTKPYLSGIVELYEDISDPVDDLDLHFQQAHDLPAVRNAASTRQESRETIMSEHLEQSEPQKGHIPDFQSYEEEAAFWDTHDFSEIWGEAKPVQAQVAEHLSEYSLSKKLEVRFDAATDQELADKARERGVKKTQSERIPRMKFLFCDLCVLRG